MYNLALHSAPLAAYDVLKGPIMHYILSYTILRIKYVKKHAYQVIPVSSRGTVRQLNTW